MLARCQQVTSRQLSSASGRTLYSVQDSPLMSIVFTRLDLKRRLFCFLFFFFNGVFVCRVLFEEDSRATLDDHSLIKGDHYVTMTT